MCNFNYTVLEICKRFLIWLSKYDFLAACQIFRRSRKYVFAFEGKINIVTAIFIVIFWKVDQNSKYFFLTRYFVVLI